MPTYEYECENCNYHFEKFQKMSDEAIKECPECEGPVRRLISGGAGFIFKGAGFYATEYRSKEYKEQKKKEEAIKKGEVKKEEKKDKKNETKKTKAIKDDK